LAAIILTIIDSDGYSQNITWAKNFNDKKDSKFRLTIGMGIVKILLIGAIILTIIYLFFIFFIVEKSDDPTIIIGLK